MAGAAQLLKTESPEGILTSKKANPQQYLGNCRVNDSRRSRVTKMRAEGSATLGSNDGEWSQVFSTRMAG